MALMLGILIAGAPVSTQESRLKTATAASSIEVDVRDARGNVVGGLTAADFLVSENGQPRRVISAELLRPRMLPKPAAVPTAAPDTSTNRDTEAAGLVLFLVDDSTPMPPSDGLRVIPLVTEAIRRVPTTERIGLVFAAATKQDVPFSYDRQRLIDAARRFVPRADLRSAVSNSETLSTASGASFLVDDSAEILYRRTIRSLRDAVTALAVQPYRRKSLVFFSIGLPLPPGDRPGGSAATRNLIQEREALFVHARALGISINTVDPSGLRADGGSVQSPTGVQSAGGAGRLNREFLASLAQATGGLFAGATNDPAPAIERMLNDAASFYLLRFEAEPSASSRPASTVAVTSTQGSATIRQRNAARNATAGASALAEALARPTLGVPLDMALIDLPAGDSRQRAVLSVVTVHRSSKENTGPERQRFTLVVSAYGADGRPVASRTTRINALIPPGEDDVQFEVVSRLNVAPGWYSVRAAIETEQPPTHGSVFGDIEIPAGKGGLSLSRLTVATSPPLMWEPRSALDGLDLPVPTARRVFQPSDQLKVVAFASADSRASRDGFSVSFEILTEDGDRVTRNVRELSQADLARGFRQVSFSAELAEMKRGAYWVVVQAYGPNNSPFTRSTRFEIR